MKVENKKVLANGQRVQQHFKIEKPTKEFLMKKFISTFCISLTFVLLANWVITTFALEWTIMPRLIVALICLVAGFILNQKFIPADNSFSSILVLVIIVGIYSWYKNSPQGLPSDRYHASSSRYHSKRFVNNYRANAKPARLPTAEEIAQYEELVKEAAQAHSLPVNLVKAVITVESSWDPNAVSPTGCSGLMQLCKRTARAKGLEVSDRKDERFDVRKNVFAGCEYLAEMIDTANGNTALGLAYYNKGPNASSAKIRHALQKYSAKILVTADGI